MNNKLIKILGMAATAMGIGATLITGWVDDKKMDIRLSKRLLKHLPK